MSAEAVGSGQFSVNSKMSLRQRLERAMPGVKDFFVHILGQVRILKKLYPGVMHFMIFWGVTIQVIGTAINILNMKLFIPWVITVPRNGWYLGYELVMDIAGAFILLGVLMAAIRRYIWRPKYLDTKWDDTLALILLFLIAFVGFTNEGIRLMVTKPAWAAWSPVGNWAAAIMTATGFPVQEAAASHDALVYIHVILALSLVALLPFTKMRHLVNTPLNILVRPRRKTGELAKIEAIETTEQLGVGKVAEFTSQQLLSFDACLRCGRCEDACPSTFSGMPYSPKELVQMLRKTMVSGLMTGETKPEAEIMGDALSQSKGAAMSEEYPWQCTTCGACLLECPAFISPVDAVVDLRRYQLLTSGKMPKSVGDTMRNMERQGNPWGMPPENRMAWAEGLNVRELAPGQETDVLFFTGCAAAFEERNKKVARAFVKLMQKAGVDFATLGFDETCCGETARRMGHEYIFQEFAKQNIETFSKVKFERIVTACPHCFNTLKNEYPQMGGDYQVLHYTELLKELSEGGAWERGSKGDAPQPPSAPAPRLAFHDSCYLGRYNNIYAEPRALLDKAGVNRVEMARKGENSFCCGGGGGGMWLETDANTRINHRRLKDALDAKAEVVATACPYCLLMFDDAIRSKGIGEQIKVMDIAELLAAQMES
jgi:Fe-S oxidoreductase/nitrate reductase gamma subunit